MNKTVVIEVVVVVVVVIVGGRIVIANSRDWPGREWSQLSSELIDWKLEIYMVINGGGGGGSTAAVAAERQPEGVVIQLLGLLIWRLPL